MGTLEILLVALVILVIVALLALVLMRGRRVVQANPPVGSVHPQAPAYRLHSQLIEYYRPQEKKAEMVATPSAAGKRDPRKEPLPHCPLCNAAVGFEDKTCPKCRHELNGT
jgi:hypothetical protein